MEFEIKKISTSKLISNKGQIDGVPQNPRFIKDDRYNKLVQSLRDDPEMLSLRELFVYPFESKYIVIAGNMRLKACTEVGIKEIPCKIIPTETPAEKIRAYAIKDNIGYGEDDIDILANEWDEAELEHWGMELPVNFNPKDAEEDDYEIPDEIETDIVRGDIIEIGEHRLMCGDSTNSDDVDKLMNGMLADMVHTDPPYNVDYGANKKHPSHKIRTIENDKLDADSWESFCKAIYSNFKLFNKGDIYMWGASSPEGMKMRLWLVESGCHWSATIIWKKNRLVLTPAKYQRLYEPCFYGWFDKSSYRADRKEVELWEVDRPSKSKEHPTMKPLALCAKAINNSSRERDIVLDLFLGSGSTMVACHQINRKCYGIEIDPKYCEVIIDRMLKLDPNIDVRVNGATYQKKETVGV